MPTLCFIDIETGGFDPKANPITQIACLAVDSETAQIVDTYEAKIRFRRENCHAKAMSLRSYDGWDAVSKHPKEVAHDFKAFLDKHASIKRVSKEDKPFRLAIPVAYNAKFDVDFLVEWFKRLDTFFAADAGQRLCVMELSKWYFSKHSNLERPNSFKLVDVASYFGIDLSNAHDALADITATYEIWKRII